MADRLRDLIDLVVGTLDDPDGGGETVARRAGFSRDHLDRVLRAATGETPVALRRRLLLERAAWQLRDGASASEAATAAGYGSLAAFSRAFSRAHGLPPSAFAASDRPVRLQAPNGVHFLAPGGLSVPSVGTRDDHPRDALSGRLVRQHLDRVRELLVLAAGLPRGELARPLRPGWTAVWFEGEEASAVLMAERLVATLEVWTAAVRGEHAPASSRRDGPPPGERLLERLDRVGPVFAAFTRRVRDEGSWDDAFVDALCEPPQAFTFGGVVAHVLTYGAVRREMLAAVLGELGATVAAVDGDPIMWEAGRGPEARRPAAG